MVIPMTVAASTVRLDLRMRRMREPHRHSVLVEHQARTTGIFRCITFSDRSFETGNPRISASMVKWELQVIFCFLCDHVVPIVSSPLLAKQVLSIGFTGGDIQ